MRIAKFLEHVRNAARNIKMWRKAHAFYYYCLSSEFHIPLIYSYKQSLAHLAYALSPTLIS